MQEAVPVGVGGMAAVISENIDIDMLKKQWKVLRLMSPILIPPIR